MPRYNTSRKPSSQQLLATPVLARKRIAVTKNKKSTSMSEKKERPTIIRVMIDFIAIWITFVLQGSSRLNRVYYFLYDMYKQILIRLQRATTRSTTNKSQPKLDSCSIVSERTTLQHARDSSNKKEVTSNRSSAECKTTSLQRSRLSNPVNASIQQQQQQQSKNRLNGPTSPTEASIAPPIFHNGTLKECKNGELTKAFADIMTINEKNIPTN